MILMKVLEKIIKRNQVSGELSLMCMSGKIVNKYIGFRADYKDCIDFLHLIDRMKLYMLKAINIRIKALDSIVENKYSRTIARESKRFMSVNKKIDKIFKKVCGMAFGFYNMIY